MNLNEANKKPPQLREPCAWVSHNPWSNDKTLEELTTCTSHDYQEPVVKVIKKPWKARWQNVTTINLLMMCLFHCEVRKNRKLFDFTDTSSHLSEVGHLRFGVPFNDFRGGDKKYHSILFFSFDYIDTRTIK